GVMILAGLGLGLEWRWSRRGPDLLAAGGSAYSQGDWSRAADLARQRVKMAPSDLEALRLLARSTARLGHDAGAHALFARVGFPALRAEALSLRGRGLARAGRKEEAGRVWEKAVELQPDYAEALEQLIIRDTSRNRLAQATQLAERLAQQPGWEL